jgi:hypothetical protein
MLIVGVWVGDVSGQVEGRGEESVVLAGEVGAECGGDGVGEENWRYGGTWYRRCVVAGLGI